MTTPDRLAAAVAQGHEDAVQAWPQEDGCRCAAGRYSHPGRDCTPAPVSSPAGEDVQERAGTAEVAEVDRLVESVLCDHRITTRQTTIGERYGCETPDCDYDTEDWTAWEEHVAPHVRAALAAASLLRQDPPQDAGDHSLNALCLLDGCVAHGTAVAETEVAHAAPPQVAGEDVERVAREWADSHDELVEVLAVAGEAAEPVVVRENFRIWTLTEDEDGQWWAWSWREEGEDWKPRRVEELRFPLAIIHAPAALSARPVEAQEVEQVRQTIEAAHKVAGEWMARAEAAEAVIEKVRGLAAGWRADGPTDTEPGLLIFLDRLDAALSGQPVAQDVQFAYAERAGRVAAGYAEATWANEPSVNRAAPAEVNVTSRPDAQEGKEEWKVEYEFGGTFAEVLYQGPSEADAREMHDPSDPALTVFRRTVTPWEPVGSEGRES